MINAKTIKKIFNRIGKVQKHPYLRRFIEHNKRAFPIAPDAGSRQPVVLFELNGMQSAHIAYSYLANVLAEDEQARIVAYLPKAETQFWRKMYFWIKQVIRFDRFGTYASFGVTHFFQVTPTPAHKAASQQFIEQILPTLRCKLDVEQMDIHGVTVGDLIYDNYLMRYKKPTIDIASAEFLEFLQESVETFMFWKDYLDSNDVRAINVSHCVYNIAIPLRLAVARGILVFQVNATHVYRLSSQNLFAYNDFHFFRERFAALPDDVRDAGLAKAEQQIARRFTGEVGVDMTYSSKSAYGNVRKERLLVESSRKKVLIATHCFFDSPHCYGGSHIFPDFYEWLDFLGRMTECTDYDWYIKTHPDYRPGTMEIIQEFIARYPQFTLLPADASHHQIIAEGIDVALTIHGTIAFEYAALRVPVVNASWNNPHIAYDFNLHPVDVDDYQRILADPDCWNLQIYPKQVHEYYFMRHIYNSENIFFDDYRAIIEQLGGYQAQFNPVIYDKWLAEFTPEKHQRILASLRRFVKSGDFRMDYTHDGREFSIELIGASN